MATVDWQYLPWLFRWIVTLVENTGVDTGVFAPVAFPEDSDEKVEILFSVSLNEFTAILSALEKGAPLSYPDTDQEVIWYFLRNYEYPVSLCEAIANAIATCEEVEIALADKIASSEMIQDAMVEALQANDEFNEFVKSEAQRAAAEQWQSSLTTGDCDNSVVAGEVIQIVDVLDTNNTDFLQIVEVGTNDEERISLLLAAIPGLSESPADEILTLFQGLLEEFTENYAAAVTLSWKNEVAEDLYCLARVSEDCNLTYEQIFNYFNARVGSGLTIGSAIKNIVQFVINGDFSTDDLVASGMYAVQLAFIIAGRDFYGLNIPLIGGIVRDALPSSAWEDWTECESDWCRSLTGDDLHEFFEGSGGLGAQALWTGTGWGPNNALINSRITLHGDMGGTNTLVDIVCIYSGTNAVGSLNSVTVFTSGFGSSVGSSAWSEETLVATPATLAEFEIDTASSFDTSVPITVELIEVRISGTGSEPSFGQPC